MTREGTLELYAEGRLADLGETDRRHLMERGAEETPETAASVAALIGEVRSGGDEALRDMALRFDGASLNALEIPREHWDEAVERLAPEVRRALDHADLPPAR